MPQSSISATCTRLKSALAAGPNCEADTLIEISTLLIGDDHVLQNGQPYKKRAKTPTSNASTRPLQPTKPAVKTKNSTQLHVLKEKPQVSLGRDKEVIATEVFNAALESLSQAILAQDASSPRSTSDTQKTTSEHPSGNRLVERSPNKVSNVSSTSSNSKTSAHPIITQQNDRGLEIVAESASVALRYLGKEYETVPLGSERNLWKLETASLSFIRKLIALKLGAFAQKELINLRKLLNARLDPANGQHRVDFTEKTNLSTRKAKLESRHNESPPSLLNFENYHICASALPIVIEFQNLALKALIAVPSIVKPETLSNNLSFQLNNSLPSLLLRLIKLNESDDRILRQLDILSHSLLSISTKIGRIAGKDATNGQLSEHSECFKLQSVALEARAYLVITSGKQGDLDSEILQPFSKCLLRLASKSRHQDAPYPLAEDAMNRLIQILFPGESWRSCSGKSSAEHILEIYHALSDLAYRCGNFSKALDWIKMYSQQSSISERSEEESILHSSRLASMYLFLVDSISQGKEVKKHLQNALERIRMRLGEKELNSHRTVIEMVTLMKSTARYLQSKAKDRRTTNGADVISIQQACKYILISIVTRFRGLLVSLSGCKFTASSDPGMTQRLILETSKYAIDAVLLFLAHDIRSQQVSWEMVDNSIQACSMLAEVLRATTESENACYNSADDAKSSHFVKFSNIYWMVYLSTKESKKPAEEKQHIEWSIVQKSCDALVNCCPFERMAASLPGKLEKLARFYVDRHEYASARDALVAIVKMKVDLGILERLAKAANTLSLHALEQHEPETTGFIGSLRSIVDIDLKSAAELQDLEGPFDMSHLNASERGLHLEWQLGILLRYQQAKKSLPGLHQSISTLFHHLLAIYPESSYPVRRRRVVLKMIRLQSSFSTAINAELSSLLEAFVEGDPISQLGHDAKLGKYLDYITTSFLAHRIIGSADSTQAPLEDLLRRWRDIIDNCPSWSAVEEVIEDPLEWREQLETLCDYQATKGYYKQQIITRNILLKFCNINPKFSPLDVLKATLKLGSALLQAGHQDSLDVFMGNITQQIGDVKLDLDSTLTLEVLHLENLVASNALTKCNDKSSEIRKNFSQLHEIFASNTSRTTEKVQAVLQAVDCLLAYARFKARSGEKPYALNIVQSAVTSLQRVWKSLESRQKSISETNKDSDISKSRLTMLNTAGDSGIESVDQVRLCPHPKDSSTTDRILWPLVPKLFESLVDLSKLHYLMGNFQEATYHLYSAQTLADGVSSQILKGRVTNLIGDYRCRGKELEEGQKLLNNALQTFSHESSEYGLVSSYCSLGYSYRLNRSIQSELNAYDNADAILSKLSNHTRQTRLECEIPQLSRIVEKVAKSLEALRLEERPEARPRSRANHKRVPSQKPVTRTVNEVPKHQNVDLHLPRGLTLLQNEVVLLKAEARISQQDLANGVTLLNQLKGLCFTNRDTEIKYQCLEAKTLLESALSIFSTDPVFSMLKESALALPSIAKEGKYSTRSKNLPVSSGGKLDGHKAILTKKKTQHRVEGCEKAFDCLKRAINIIGDLPSEASRFSTLVNTAQICSTFAKISMLQSIAPESGGETVCSLAVAHAIELPNLVASIRDRVATEVDRVKPECEIIKWPDEKALHEKADIPTYGDFQRNFLDSIPSDWIIVSMTLDEDKQQLHLNRYEREKSPFILQLPLARQHAEEIEDEHEIFGFAEAKAELHQIVEESDATVHGARDHPEELKVKGAKTKWWTEREALDSRLKELLVNIESLWLGGFKSLFSVRKQDAKKLEHFQQNFDQLLNNYLPSRSKSTRKAATSSNVTVNLDSHLYALFLGLEHQQDEGKEGGVDEDSYEDAITDLLYFIVDALQFNGERNAYDEIDFDSLIVETRDLLRSYHKAANDAKEPCSSSSAAGATSRQHIILVLDKELHDFPWECLPCLSGRSVSRVTSLLDIEERLPRQDGGRAAIVSASKERGTYILNPSQDLARTQMRFETALSSLCTRGWSNIVNRAPSEEEFASALDPSSSSSSPIQENHRDSSNNVASRITLYFGHGAGTQYIRRRRIAHLRRCPARSSPSLSSSHSASPSSLPSSSSPHAGTLTSNSDNIAAPAMTGCNTTLLFGCSSASLKEAGEFEPYGTPKTYLLAGAPALLGALWDVTDGDCDAFAKGVLTRWGLLDFPPSEEDQSRPDAVSSRKKRKGNSNTNKAKSGGTIRSTDITSNQPMCLTEAVARSREDCYLKYLNGAAMVVYGVPVYLS